MANKIHAILRAVAATPWAIQEEKLHAILEMLELRAAGGKLSAEDVARIKAENRAPRASMAGKVAVLPLYGVVAQRMNVMTDFSGGTSTEKFAALFDDALSRPDVDAIVIDVDSPGGAVEGTPELAARIFGARGKKPMIAIANSLMASAAYWIASACDEVVATQLAQVGSIGVFTVHTDMSQAEANDGVKHTIISAGKYKTEGSPLEPLTAEAKAAIQASVDDIYSMFVSDIAKHRGTGQSAVRDGYGQGRALVGRAALNARLVDRIDTLDGVIGRLVGKGSRSRMAAIADSRHNHAGEQLVSAGGTTGGSVTTTGASTPALVGGWPNAAGITVSAIDGASLSFDAAAPHNERYLAFGAQLDDEDERCAVCGAELDDEGECPNGHPQPADDDQIDEGPPKDNQSRRDALGAGTRRSSTAPHRQAPVPGKENTVGSTNTAPGNGASATPPPPSVADQIELLDLASAHGKSSADVKAWIEAGKTTGQVMAELLAEHRTAARPITSAQVGADRAVEKPWERGFGQMMVAIIQDSMPNGRRDPRLAKFKALNFRAGSASGMDEAVGSEGGFFIQPELLPTVIDPVYKEDPILSRVTRIPVGSDTNGVKYNVVDETARTTGNRWGGVQGYWLAEAATFLASKPKLRLFELNLKKLIFLAYLTDELIQDAPAAESLLTRAFQAEYGFMVAAAIFSGIGGGQPLGFLKSGALQTIAIEGSQTIANSAQYLGLNIPKMLAAVPSSLWGDLIWLYQQELLPYLMNAQIAGSSAGAAVPIFVPMGGFTQRPFDMILGRPAFPSELCPAVGTPGDLIALVPSQYHLGEKGGVRMDQSIHVKFLTDEMTLRWVARLDGAPIWRKPVTPFTGAVARSPFVVLNTRS